MFTFRIVPQGQRVAVWDKHGQRTIVDGPRRLTLWGQRVEKLEPFVAGPKQYLVIEYHDGRVEHLRGPTIVWLDRVVHLKISVADAIPLDANEALVVYRQQAEHEERPGTVQRRIVRGPELFVPHAQEWLHTFQWHGADPKDPRRKVPCGLIFQKLRIIPDQLYFDVESVRTADDALVVVKLMIFFELMEINVMLDQTHDVVSDFINAVTADVIDFAARHTFEQFKEKTEQLNARETYPQLAQRLGRIGYRLNKVVYRGYRAADKLQAMHDNAIETRTRLKLEAETEVQAQGLADLKQHREQDRARERQAMEQADTAHKQKMQQMTHEQTLRQQQAEQSQRLTTQRENGELKIAQRQATYQQRMEFLKSVRDLQVDMTRYLVAKNEKPDRRIRLEGDRRAQLHLHEG